MTIDELWAGLQAVIKHVVGVTAGSLLSPSSDLSLASLACALVIATLWLSRRHFAARREVRIRALARLLFPKRWLLNRSAGLDLKLLVLNVMVFGVIFAGAVISQKMIASGTHALLVGGFGARGALSISDLMAAGIVTIAIFLAYELGYWVHHYLSHKVPFLWEMHKVHHSAEVLTPLTNSRVHPIEGVTLLNTLALFIGVADGLATYGLGREVKGLTIANGNMLIVIFTYLLAHLHHTHVWIAFTGTWGRLFISPAHHQIHHSANPVHFDKNMGSVLAIFDWMFGTLHVPEKKRERLDFGIGAEDRTEHTVTQELMRPVTALAHGIRQMVPEKPESGESAAR